MKVSCCDPTDTPGPSGPLSGTSCPPQPHLIIMRTPKFFMYFEAFLRGDQSIKVVCCDPLDMCGRLVCVWVCACVVAGSLFWRYLPIAVCNNTRLIVLEALILLIDFLYFLFL